MPEFALTLGRRSIALVPLILKTVANKALIALMLVAAFCQDSLGQEDLTGYFIEGFSQPRRVSEVATAATGIIGELIAREGEPIQEGDCLLKIDDRIQQKLLKIADINRHSHGELDAAKSELRGVERRLKIIETLVKHGSATPEELLRIQSEYELAQANVRTMKEKLILREAEYERLVVESQNYCVAAPFDGVLVEFTKQRGEYVGPVDPMVCVVAELSTLSVNFLVPRQQRFALELYDEVEILFLEADKNVSGTVAYISPYPNGETNTYTVKVHVPNLAGKLNAGERCQLTRVIAKRSGPPEEYQRTERPHYVTTPADSDANESDHQDTEVQADEALESNAEALGDLKSVVAAEDEADGK